MGNQPTSFPVLCSLFTSWRALTLRALRGGWPSHPIYPNTPPGFGRLRGPDASSRPVPSPLDPPEGTATIDSVGYLPDPRGCRTDPARGGYLPGHASAGGGTRHGLPVASVLGPGRSRPEGAVLIFIMRAHPPSPAQPGEGRYRLLRPELPGTRSGSREGYRPPSPDVRLSLASRSDCRDRPFSGPPGRPRRRGPASRSGARSPRRA